MLSKSFFRNGPGRSGASAAGVFAFVAKEAVGLAAGLQANAPAAECLAQDILGDIDKAQAAQFIQIAPAEIQKLAAAAKLALGKLAIGQQEAGVVPPLGVSRRDGATDEVQRGECRRTVC